VGLTSPGLPYLLALLAFVVLLAIVLGWPWLSRYTFTRIGLRLLSMCVLQALVLGLIFVVVNNQGEFYSSWSDLFGTDTGGKASIIAAGTVNTASRDLLAVTGKTAIRLPGGRPGGILQDVRIDGQLSGIAAAGRVYLPAAYFARGPRRDFPVLTVISDAAEGGNSPYSAQRLAQSAAAEISSGRMGPVVIVWLPATVGGEDHACLNLPPVLRGHTQERPAIQGETFFAQDVPEAIDSAYRVIAAPASRAVLADQSGGYCALHLAIDDSGVFSVAVAPRADYTRPPGAAARLPGPFKLQDNLLWQLDNLPVPPVSVLFAGPGSDTGAGAARSFMSLTQRPMRVTTTELDAGNWPLAHVLDWVAAAVGAPGSRGQAGAAR
jgi:Putative esterase